MSSPRHVLAVDGGRGLLAWINPDGSTRWEHPVQRTHDLHVLPNGHILTQESWTQLIELDPTTGTIVWRYDAAAANGNDIFIANGGRVEVHAFQRLANGHTVIFESGTARVIEVNADGEHVHEFPMTIDHPNPHRDTRLARVLANGNFLIAHERDGVVREYDREGTVVWSYAVPLFGRERIAGHGLDGWGNQIFSAVRLPDGDTLIGTGNGHSVLRVNQSGEIVWHLTAADLIGDPPASPAYPDLELAWITTVQPLPNGNLIVGNCRAGRANPQLFEVTPDKQIVWTFRDFDRFGNSLTNAWVMPADALPAD